MKELKNMKFWYQGKSILSGILMPITIIYGLIIYIRRILYSLGILSSYKSATPIIVVGNISVGGTGKTPIVIWLANEFIKRNRRVAVISRGYGSKSDVYPLLINKNMSPDIAGDEPLLIYKHTQVPVVIGADRQKSVELLETLGKFDYIISDDGLQHYKLIRNYEIVIVDAQREFGNQLLLPSGPLREHMSKLRRVNYIIYNGTKKATKFVNKNLIYMNLTPTMFVNVKTNKQVSIDDFKSYIKTKNLKMQAVAGIGNPERFFNTLSGLGLYPSQSYTFSDHYKYKKEDFIGFDHDDNNVLIMTEKDSIKVGEFAKENWWYMSVEPVFNEEDQANLIKDIIEKAV